MPGQNKGIYCAAHALEDMIDVKNSRCLKEGCFKFPVFNMPGLKKGIYCKAHALEEMIDVANLQCLEEECLTQPMFNMPGLKKGIYCKAHALKGMVDVKNKRCVLCDIVSANARYDNHCYGCYSFKYPNDPRVRNFKTKEQAIMSEIAKAYPEIILDKMISGGCSRKRPDGLIELNTHVIIVEVDEHQHKGYDTTCNNRRTMTISQDLAHRPIVFIRVNPDKYKVNGKVVNSAFTLTKKTGQLTVRPKILQQRVNSVLSAIDYHRKTVPERTVTVETLYFDEYDLHAQLERMKI